MDKKRVLITGGSGSIGSAFIRRYYDEYSFYSISRNESSQMMMRRAFPEVISFIGSVEDGGFLCNTFDRVRPDVVVHTAAMKNIKIGEESPIQLCKVNIKGSLNVIEASIRADVPITVGISTDKACAPKSNYGSTKFLMEKCFAEANTGKNRFVICRFANVAGSSASVIPLWLRAKADGKSLKLTDERMNRLMFTMRRAAEFIQRTIELCAKVDCGFVSICTDMKAVKMRDLARYISDDIEIIGKMTEAEKYDEDLVSREEVRRTHIIDEGCCIILPKSESWMRNLEREYGSHNAEKMTEEEMGELIKGAS